MDVLSRLAHRARSGDRQALSAFVDASYEQVWRLCSSLVDEQSADDLAQETFTRAVRNLPRFRGEASARTWLLAVARHTCIDELRTRQRRRRRDLRLESTRWEESMVHDASEEPAVTDLVRRLEADRRTAFVLTQMLGLSYDDAAAVCACPPGTIRSRVARARADLIGLLGGRREVRGASPRRLPSA